MVYSAKKRPGRVLHTQPWLPHPQIWYHKEESYRIYKLFPSEAWDTLVSLKKMQKSRFYSYRETMVTIFYESRKLYQVPAVGLGRVVVGDLDRLSR